MADKNIPLESSIQATIIKHLNEEDEIYFEKRLGTGMGVKGRPDLMILRKGIHYEIELKRPGEVPTRLQKEHLRKAKKAGAIATWLYSWKELEAVFKFQDAKSRPGIMDIPLKVEYMAYIGRLEE